MRSLVIWSFLLVCASTLDFCSSVCIDTVNTCNSPGFGDCTVCAVSIFSLVPDGTGCVKLSQTEVRGG